MLASARIKRFFRAALKAIPILGALGVSLWTLFLYFSHDRQLKQLEFQRLTESRFTVVDPSFSLRRYSTDPELSDLYLATFAVTLQNSAAEPVEISASIVDIWHGRLGAAPTEDRASAINLPAHRWDATPRQGDVDWTLIHTSAFQVASSQSYSFLPANTEVAWSGAASADCVRARVPSISSTSSFGRKRRISSVYLFVCSQRWRKYGRSMARYVDGLGHQRRASSPQRRSEETREPIDSPFRPREQP
jgi:hypothetical protein